MSAFLYLQQYLQEDATVPPRIFKTRNVWAAAFFSFNLGAGFILTIYYLPVWFQAVKETAAIQSGIMNLPLLIAVVFVSVAAGALVTLWGHYAPFMILASILMPTGYGLLSTMTPSTETHVWILYQLIAGTGVGLGLQQPLMAVQAVLDLADVPTGTALVIFLQTLGGSISVSIGQFVFSHKLTQSVHSIVPDLDPGLIFHTGATDLKNLVEGGEMVLLLRRAYNNALMKTFLVSAVTAGATVVGSLFIEWRSVKGKKERKGDVEKG